MLDRSQRNEFGQIYLRPRDMLKLGLLIHQRGVWQGRRVISESWIDAAVARQSRVDDSDYGLGIWHRWYGVPTANGTQRVETIMLSGNGGQKVYIVPSLELVVVFTGGAFNVESPVNTIMARVLLPALLDAEPLSPANRITGEYMSKLRFRISLSLDGFAAGPNQSLQEPLGIGGDQLHEWVFPLEIWLRAHGKEGGEVNESTPVMEAELANIGATSMGRNMFGGHPVAPILLGGGERLFDTVADLHGLVPVQTVAAPNVVHLKFARQ